LRSYGKLTSLETLWNCLILTHYCPTKNPEQAIRKNDAIATPHPVNQQLHMERSTNIGSEYFNQLSTNKPTAGPANSIDHKFNVVIYGIKENPSGTFRSSRTRSDILIIAFVFYSKLIMILLITWSETAYIWESL